MLVLVQVLTAVLALSSYCDFLTYGNDHRETSSSFPKDSFTAPNSGIAPLDESGFGDTSISETVTKLSTVWTATAYNPSSPIISTTIPETTSGTEGIISEGTSQQETLRTEPPTDSPHSSTEVQTTSNSIEDTTLGTEITTDLSHTSEVETTSTIVTSTTTATTSSSTSLVTTPNLTNNGTSPFVTLSTTDRTSTVVTTPETTSATTPPTCRCDSMELVLGELVMGDSWFAVAFNSTSFNPLCEPENLTGLNVTVNGPSDKNDEFPSKTQFCFPTNISCLIRSNNSFLFNSSLCCAGIIDILQCSNYNFSLTPQYSTCSGNSNSFGSEMFTLPGPDVTPKNVTVRDTGSDWVSIGWQDLLFCEKTVVSYFMRFDPLCSKEGNDTIEVLVACVNRSSVTGATNFTSKMCPELFNFGPCTNYSVTIEVAIFEQYRYRSQPSQSVTFNTEPPENLVAQVDKQVESGSDWLAFQWKLSEPQCQTVTTGFQLNLTNSRNNSYETYDCNITGQQSFDSKFVFNTSSNDCGKSVDVTPCSDYEIVVIPEISNSLYDGSRDSAFGRTTCEPITASVISIDSGSDWITFNWTTSVEDCRQVLTGFWLSIVSTEQRGQQDSLQFISMKDCYCNLKEDQAIMFNTSTACQNWVNPGILPCSEYDIYIIPQFFDSLNGSASPNSKTSTLPDDGITPVTQNVKAGGNWISFEWQASTNTCRDAVTGLWISMNHNLSYLCPINATDEKFITFNTSSTCFNEILSPCNRYTFEIQLDIHGEVGKLNKVGGRTTPGDNVTALINNEKYGVEWISFRWQSSVRECQSLVAGYQLNVTDLFNGISQFRDLNRNCSDNLITHSELVFNSSLPCTQLTISPCSNYLVSLTPVFRIDNMTVTNGVNAFIEIGTQSGVLGEIKNPVVASQGTNSLTLEWFEPTCRNLSYYNVSVIPNWNLEPGNNYDQEKYLNITSDCLEKRPSGSVSLTLNNTTCQSGYKFVSCAPYNIKVLPVYKLPSANENLAEWTNNTQTLPLPYEASVNNLSVQDIGTRWISISWPIPTCRVPVSAWILSESESHLFLPPDCPANVTGSHLTLNISDTIVCRNSETIPSNVSFIPCVNYSLGMNVKYPDLVVQNGSNNVITAVTKVEPPGIVHNLTGHGTSNSVLLKWTEPTKNPQCVQRYAVHWNNQTIFTTKTQHLINGLEPCSMLIPVTVSALANSSHELYESQVPIIVSTSSVDPAPVVSEIDIVRLQNGWTRNISWLKPEVDDCISGYNVSIKKATSTDIVYNLTVKGKDSTWITLNEGFEQGNLYNISISSFCSFKKEISESNYTTHAFTWDSASNMIDVTAVVCGIIIPILAFAILYAIMLIRKSQSSVLAPEKYPEEVSRSTPSRKTHNRTSSCQRPVLIKELRSTIEWLEADSSYELSREYELIKSMADTTVTCVVAKTDENRAKNRYIDILPYDHSRVRLTTVPPSSDYINASYISGYTGPRAYIAAQGPKPSTIEDFWLMCFEQNVKIIVALTRLEEKGRVKCAQYWPSTGSCEFGDIRVKLTKEVSENNYIIRDFLITKISSNGNVIPAKFTKQMHFTEWPDFGCPDNPEELINFVHAMRDKSISLSNKYRVTCPIVVHCSAGVGRTGTLIALDILMEQARNKKIIDVMNTVVKLRKDRDRMVQTEDQYRFLYQCIYTYARNELQLNKLTESSSLKSTKSSDGIALTPLSFFQKDPFANNFSRKSSFTAA